MSRAPIPTNNPHVRELLTAWDEFYERWQAAWPMVAPLAEEYGEHGGPHRAQQWDRLGFLDRDLAQAGVWMDEVRAAKPTDDRYPEMTVQCPHCEAQPGIECHVKGHGRDHRTIGCHPGTYRTKFHKARTAAAASPPPALSLVA